MYRSCLFCGTEFPAKKVGSGGTNRQACFTCVPENLSREQRNVVRNNLLSEKNKAYKLAIGCRRCGYNRCYAALEWHHPGDDKEMNPGTALTRGWEAYLKEIEKCTLLCANCHREAHFEMKQ